MSRDLKIIHIGLGPIGIGIARMVLAKEGLKVVGACDSAPEKANKDLGDLLGLNKKLKIKVSNNIGEKAWLLATAPDATARNPEEAVKLAKRALELGPQNAAYWNTLGVAQYRAGAWKEASLALQKSMELRNGGDAFDWFFIGMAHWQLGQKEEARMQYERALQWMKENLPQESELRRFRSEAEALLGINYKEP